MSSPPGKSGRDNRKWATGLTSPAPFTLVDIRERTDGATEFTFATPALQLVVWPAISIAVWFDGVSGEMLTMLDFTCA